MLVWVRRRRFSFCCGPLLRRSVGFDGGNTAPCRHGIELPVGYSDNRPVVTSKAGGLFEAP